MSSINQTERPSVDKPWLPLGQDGFSNEKTATATCYCGSVQLEFVSINITTGWNAPPLIPSYTLDKQPVEGDDMVDSFICNCTDCRKITASVFASNLIIRDRGIKHLRGRDKLTEFGQNRTIVTGNTMTNYFCSVCGTLMYRISSASPDKKIMRLGTVDDFNLHETKLKPRIEQFCKDRVAWFSGGDGVKQYDGNYYGGSSKKASV
ncbi:hypothetical protein PFICI_04118 [Pestalotiopsis fici W106-1]|uniref:CENP-V/GFA domain-containing protein n=1 Tax=Pestalotiopsis fici (strain W106-1 / CGMCC3.15140) TaxID=1229662 RepID=W3XJ49_PESFW|nr:uncharacterized protein PFICI_04118 [Pestalotiopsis fici W106-1]ETS86093.1 hypothetical protein PFICI_04118 [Pestalotiopsis fici W106-1]